MIDVSEAFDDLLQTIPLKRKSAGSRDENGNWVDGAITTTNIEAVVQSLTADERLALPEAIRSRETIKFHTKTEIKTADATLGTTADKVLYQGREWEVTQVFNRDIIGGYYKAIGVKV